VSSGGRLHREATEPGVENVSLPEFVDGVATRHPTVGLAVGVVDRQGGSRFHGHGVADIETRAPITETTVFRVASITKTFTAIAIMQLWEQGRIDLDGPVSDYLHSYELVPRTASSPPTTVRQLLTHTAGLPEVAHVRRVFQPDFGESVEAGRRLPTLAEFYGGHLQLGAEPGSRFIYNNHGPATLGQIVEDLTEQSLAEYFHECLFDPLGMADSSLIRSARLEQRRATGYEIGRSGVRRVAERDMVTAGAASIYSTPSDMGHYLSAILGQGSNEHGTILRPETMDLMFDAHYQPDPRVPGMGLGFFRRFVGGNVVVGHQGSHPGFHSQILLAPGPGLAVMAFTNGANQADLWLPGETTRLLRHLVGVAIERPFLPHHPSVWDDLCGWYRLSARFTDIRFRAMMGAGVEVFVRGGRLMLRFLTPIPELAGGFPLHPADPDDPYAYRIDLSDTGFDHLGFAFGQDSAGATNRVHLDLMPLTLEKQPDFTNPSRWIRGGLAVASAAAVASLLHR
jgi:CubicO group peptidase (beta-lactamase class C family)